MAVHVLDALEQLMHNGARLLLAERHRLGEQVKELAFRRQLEYSEKKGGRGEKVVDCYCKSTIIQLNFLQKFNLMNFRHKIFKHPIKPKLISAHAHIFVQCLLIDG